MSLPMLHGAALALVAGAIALPLPVAVAAANLIGTCEMTGAKGDMAIAAPARAGQLTVAVNLPAPIWWNGDSPATIKDGYEYCLAAAIAWHSGFDKLQIVNADWGPLVAGQLKDFDFALSEIAITDEHRTAADFSVPYFDLDVGVLVKKATAIDEHSIKTMRVGVLQNSAAAAVVTAALKLKSMNSFAEEGELFTALRSGQIDAAIADMPIVLTEELQETGVLEVAGQYKSGRVYGALYPKGSTNAAAFNSTITALQVDGTLKRLAGKYFTPVWGKDPATVPYFNP